MEIDTFSLLLGFCGAALVGLTKTGVPGLGILVVPLMARVFPAKLSVGALLPMLICGDVFGVAYYRRHAQWNKLWGLFPCLIVGLAGGTLVLSKIDSAQLRPLLGCTVLGLVSLELLRRRFNWQNIPNQWWFVVFIGTLAGFVTTVGNAAGSIMGIYLLSKGLPKRQFMGTRAWYFLIVNCIKVPIFWRLGMITAETLRFDLYMAPMIAISALAGKMVLHKIPQGFFNWLVLSLAAVAALHLILG